MEGSDLRIRVEDDGGDVRVVLVGDFDVASAPAVNACLLSVHDRTRRVLLDIGGVTFMDSKALSLLIGVSRNAADVGWQLAITAPRHDAVIRLFELTDAARLLPMSDESGVDPSFYVCNTPK